MRNIKFNAGTRYDAPGCAPDSQADHEDEQTIEPSSGTARCDVRKRGVDPMFSWRQSYYHILIFKDGY